MVQGPTIQTEVVDTSANLHTNTTSSNNHHRLSILKSNAYISEDDPKFRSDIDNANFLSQLTFGYVYKLIKNAFSSRNQGTHLNDHDLITFPYKYRPDTMEADILEDMYKQKAKNPSKKPSLAVAIFNSTKWMTFKCLSIAIIFSFVRIITGWVLKKLIDAYEVYDMAESYMWSGILAPCLIVGFFLEHHYNHIGTYFPVHVRGALVSLIYNKVSKLSLYTLTKVSTGQIINLASNDVNVFDEFGVYFPKLLVAPFVLVACGALLWQYFGPFCLIGLGYIVIWFPLQTLYFVKNENHAQERNHTSDERVRLTSESIEGIRLLKMYAWELRFKKEIFALREKETDMLRKELVEEGLWRGISFSALAVASFLIYMPYSLCGGDLTAGKVFSTYYLFAFIRLYGAFFVNQGLLFLIQASIVVNRIEKLLETPEIGDIGFEAPKYDENSIEFDNFTGYWSKNEEEGTTKIQVGNSEQTESEYPTLVNINIGIKKGSLNALVGPVGSGKTSLLMSLTGEMPKNTGALRYKGTFAYVEQEPTIFAGTFRESICFGKPYDPEFYAKVIKVCNLETDLSLFPKGDLSEIGEKGNNLSGGQKARLALARGVYADADIYLLDDPLSAVDPKVASSIFQNCISGLLKGKTVILATHQVDFAKSCDNILMMEGGKLIGSGPYGNLQDHDLEEQHAAVVQQGRVHPTKQRSAALLAVTLQKHQSDSQEQVHKTQANPNSKRPSIVAESFDFDQEPDLNPGVVTFNTYKRLLGCMGGPIHLLSILIFYVLVEMVNIAYGIILGKWVDGTLNQVKSLAILGGLVGFTVIVFFLKYVLLNHGVVQTSKTHQEKMLNRIIQAPVYFFDSNPIGQILNRFSNDVGTLDRFLSLITMDVFDNVCFIITMIITVAIIDPIHLAPLVAEVLFIGLAMWFCIHGVKQTKKFEIASKSQLFSLFSSSLSGIVIIRSYGQELQFRDKFKHRLHSSMKGSMGFALTARFLAFYSDMGYNLAEIAVIFIMTARNTVGSNASLNGFSLALILSISGILQYTLRQSCMANILIESAARIQSYWEVPNEAPLSLPVDKQLQAAQWPQKGDIAFNKVFMKYSPTGPHVIKGISLHAEAGQRIGCVGRTGAGKSSILQLLFRLQEVDNKEEKDGKIIIDNVDTSTVGLHQLRGNISIIPQSPFILSGTVRYNVDPMGKATDEEVWRTLESVRLRTHVERLPQKLDTQMTAATSVFSVGQKQLICLARSILKPAPIMIMDEATANMDQETDVYVTNKIRETFRTSTTFTIAHRLSTIANYDRVLVMDKGQIKEFDEPYLLLVNKEGEETITNEEGLFASMVKNTGPITSGFIFKLAKDAYYERKAGGNQQVAGQGAEVF